MGDKKRKIAKADFLYTLEVILISGPVSEKFIKKNPKFSRKIQILGSNSLKDLHALIFSAFDRDDEHMYEFQTKGKRPGDPKAKRYVLKGFEECGKKPEGYVSTLISELNLKVDEVFGYWFDFGDDWWHQINVLSISDEIPKSKFPKIIEKLGKSPPQYEE